MPTFFGNRNERDFSFEPQVKENQKGNQRERIKPILEISGSGKVGFFSSLMI